MAATAPAWRDRHPEYVRSMGTVTVRLPDEKHQRLRALAQSRGITLTRLIDDMTTVMLAGFDAEARFKLRADRGAGKAERGLALLDKARRQRSTEEPLSSR